MTLVGLYPEGKEDNFQKLVLFYLTDSIFWVSRRVKSLSIISLIILHQFITNQDEGTEEIASLTEFFPLRITHNPLDQSYHVSSCLSH